MNKLTTFALLALSATACTTQDQNDVSSIEGIYKVSARSHNDAACAPGGSSTLGNDTFALVTSSEAVGHQFLQVISCASPDDCRAKQAKLAAGQLVTDQFSYTVDATSSPLVVDGNTDVYTSQGASTGELSGASCVMGEVTSTSFRITGSSLQVNQEITVAADYPAINGTTCTTDAAQTAAAGQSCSQFEELDATLVETL
jgi:hypothetical protein